MLTLPPPTIPIESLRDWLIAGDRGTGADDSCEARFAAALADGAPAAWALYHDVVRPRLVASLVPLVADPREAVALTDSITGYLYVSRTNRSPDGITDLPCDVTIFDLCRAHAYTRILEKRSGPANESPLDALAIARSIVAGSPPADPRFAECHALEAKVPPEVRKLELADQLLRQRPGDRERAATVRILNLPAVLALVFFIVITVATFYILDQPASDRTDRTVQRLAEAINSDHFDDAVRLLVDDPPPGLERLEPVRPEARIQRIRELRARRLEPQLLEILSPFGRIDDTKPQIVWRSADLHGEVKLRVVQIASGRTVFEKVLAADQFHVDLDKDLPRGSSYVIALEHPRSGAQGQFTILSEDERTYVERRIADMTALAADASPRTIAFLRAHLYRAEDCIAASLNEWHSLRQMVPTSAYPREEAAWTFDSELKLPRRALLELNASD